MTTLDTLTQARDLINAAIAELAAPAAPGRELVDVMSQLRIWKCLPWVGKAPVFRATANRHGRRRNRGRRLP
jgi:hypothetical protein